MDKYREQIIRSGIEIPEDKIDDFIECAKQVSEKVGCSIKLALDMVITVAMYNKIEKDKWLKG